MMFPKATTVVFLFLASLLESFSEDVVSCDACLRKKADEGQFLSPGHQKSLLHRRVGVKGGGKDLELDLSRGIVYAVDNHRDQVFCEYADFSNPTIDFKVWSQVLFGPCDVPTFLNVTHHLDKTKLFVVDPRIVTRDTSVIHGPHTKFMQTRTLRSSEDPDLEMTFVLNVKSSPLKKAVSAWDTFSMDGMDVTYVYKVGTPIFLLKDKLHQEYIMASTGPSPCNTACLVSMLEKSFDKKAAAEKGFKLSISSVSEEDLVVESLNGVTTMVKDNLNNNYMLIEGKEKRNFKGKKGKGKEKKGKGKGKKRTGKGKKGKGKRHRNKRSLKTKV